MDLVGFHILNGTQRCISLVNFFMAPNENGTKKKGEVFDLMNLAIIFVEHSEPQLNKIVILLL